MKPAHEELHERAVTTAKEYLKREVELIGIFQELDRTRAFEKYGMPSLFAYATKLLGLSESTTTALTSIARAARKVPELKAAIESQQISFSNVRRIAPVLKAENKTEWLSKAATLPVRGLELELAKSFPDKPLPTRIYPKSETLGRLEIDLPNAVLAKLKRAQEILAQKKQKYVDAATALETVLDEFIQRHDPLEKAKRNAEKPSKIISSPVTGVVGKTDALVDANFSWTSHHNAMAKQMGFPVPRKAVPSQEKHQTLLRDGAQCTHVYPDGSRCESKQWLDLHHVRHYAQGGVHRASNLRTLCSQHHKITHSLKQQL